MQRGRMMMGILLVMVFFIAGNAVPAMAQEKPVRAKIGIQIRSADRVRRAKARDRLKVGDLLRIYVHPEAASHVLVVYRDTKTATLLNLVHQKTRSATIVMPSLDTFYQVDAESPMQTFTIICSPDALTEALEVLRTGEAPDAKWVEVEQRLLERSYIDLSQQTKKPFSIGGNVRGVGGVTELDPFVKQLQVFSGRSLVVKTYAFRVQK